LVSEDSQLPESFLLIVRTGRIVTTHHTNQKVLVTWMSTVGYSEFPAYGRLLAASSPIRRAAPIALYGNSTLGTFVTTQRLAVTSSPFISERPGHFCLAPHVAMRVGLYLHPCRLSPVRGALRAVSEDPARTCSSVRARCLPLAFMPYAMRTRRSNPIGVRCCFRRIDRTMSEKATKS
jgi:hypothetical protein